MSVLHKLSRSIIRLKTENYITLYSNLPYINKDMTALSYICTKIRMHLYTPGALDGLFDLGVPGEDNYQKLEMYYPQFRSVNVI